MDRTCGRAAAGKPPADWNCVAAPSPVTYVVWTFRFGVTGSRIETLNVPWLFRSSLIRSIASFHADDLNGVHSRADRPADPVTLRKHPRPTAFPQSRNRRRGEERVRQALRDVVREDIIRLSPYCRKQRDDWGAADDAESAGRAPAVSARLPSVPRPHRAALQGAIP